MLCYQNKIFIFRHKRGFIIDCRIEAPLRFFNFQFNVSRIRVLAFKLPLHSNCDMMGLTLVEVQRSTFSHILLCFAFPVSLLKIPPFEGASSVYASEPKPAEFDLSTGWGSSCCWAEPKILRVKVPSSTTGSSASRSRLTSWVRKLQPLTKEILLLACVFSSPQSRSYFFQYLLPPKIPDGR